MDKETEQQTETSLRIVRVPMLDTGIGREAGFKDDAELNAFAKAEREAMPPEMRERADAIDRAMEDAIINGTGN